MPNGFHFERHFTLQEAQQLVPWVRETFRKVHALLGYHGESETWNHSGGNGHRRDMDVLAAALEPSQAEHLALQLLTELDRVGIVVRDWRRGLVDFPTLLENGEEVFFCYELADGDRIQYYHGLDEGYAGRRPIDQ